MSRIMFVENRHQTRIWEFIADALMSEGHEVAFIVLNPGYLPKVGRVFQLRSPRRRDLRNADGRYDHIATTDRQVRYYGGTTSHYSHFDQSIRGVLGRFRPNMVIGETTQFYELLTVDACRESGIPYINPTSSRYPSGRFLCQLFDTLTVIGGCGEAPSDDELKQFVHNVVNRSIVPHYMKAVAAGKKPSSEWRRRRDWAYKAFQFARGERYCSPAPWRKLRQNRKNHRNLQAWNSLAGRATAKIENATRTRVLFPMHMQPEANVDVWGRPYNDQAGVVEEIATSLGNSAVLFVKPNPKPACELTDRMLQVVERFPNVVPIASSTKMDHVFPHTDLVVTITGTVAIEAIFARKPCATLIRTANNEFAGCRYIESPARISELVLELQSGRFSMHSEADALNCARRLHQETYAALITDPYTTPESLSPDNRERLIAAFKKLVPEILQTNREAGELVAG